MEQYSMQSDKAIPNLGWLFFLKIP